MSYDIQAASKPISNEMVQQQKLLKLVVQHDLEVPVMARILHVAKIWITKEELAAMAKKKPIYIETKSVAPGIFNLLPGPDYEAIVTWSDGSQTKAAGYTKEEAIARAISKGK